MPDRVTVRKPQRRQHHSWSFHQLRGFIEYKATLAGVPVVVVDPRNTSRTCPHCTYVSKANRPTRDRFVCQACGFVDHADLVAAANIGRRGAVMRPYAGDLGAVPVQGASHSPAPSDTRKPHPAR
jgi:transposase